MSDAPSGKEDPRALIATSPAGATDLPGILDEEIERTRAFIRFSRADATYRRAIQTGGYLPPGVAHSGSSFDFILDTVAASHDFSIFSKLSKRRQADIGRRSRICSSVSRGRLADLAAGRLIRLMEDWCKPFPGLHLYYPNQRQVPAAVRAVIDFFKSKRLGDA